MTAVNTKPLDTLANELWDFVGLAPDLDLPRLRRVTLSRWDDEDGWKAEAHIKSDDRAADIEGVYAYARYTGGTVKLVAPYPGSQQPSGWQMDLSVEVVVAGLRLRVLVILDADAYAEAMAADRAVAA